MKITAGKLAVTFLLLTFAGLFVEKLATGTSQNVSWQRATETIGKISTLFFVASVVCGIVAVVSKTSRVTGAIVLIIAAAIVGYFIVVLTHFNIP
jgi:uncharacterized membrane-anchored protein